MRFLFLVTLTCAKLIKQTNKQTNRKQAKKPQAIPSLKACNCHVSYCSPAVKRLHIQSNCYFKKHLIGILLRVYNVSSWSP